MKITIKKNGYEVLPDVSLNMQKWSEYISSKFRYQVSEIEYFFYGEKLVFADVRLDNGDYAEYTISPKSIHFGGHSCSFEHYDIFKKATMNDECFDGEIK